MTMPRKNKALAFGIIGAAIALAVVVVVLVVIPLVTAPTPVQPQQQQDPERQRILETPNTGQPGQPIIQHQELRAQDPVFDRYMLTVEKCFADVRTQGGPGPDITACRTAIADGVERWCGLDSEHFHDVKCKEANDDSEVFDLALRADTAGERLLG